MSNKYTSVYDWLKYIKANVVGINLWELRVNAILYLQKDKLSSGVWKIIRINA